MRPKIIKLIILVIIITLTVNSCKKEKEDLLLGTWTIKSQVDILNGARLYLLYDATNKKTLNFSSDGKVYSKGIVTPTWVFLPNMGSASYHVQGDMINIGDSVLLNNGTVVYVNFKKQFKILSIDQSLLVLQHIYPYTDPVPPVTIDSLVK